MSYAKYYQNRHLTEKEFVRIMDRSLASEYELKFTVTQNGNRRKLIGICEETGFRDFAYFTTCIEPAKKYIKVKYEDQKRQNSQVQNELE